MLFLIFVVAIGFRLIAPRFELKRLVQGNGGAKIQAFEITGQRRKAICRNPVVLDYLNKRMRNSVRSGRVYQFEGKEYDSIVRDYRPYWMRLEMSSGSYWIRCDLSLDDLCMNLPFEEKWGDEPSPNRRIEFGPDMPEELKTIWDFLLSDYEDIQPYDILVYEEDGQISRKKIGEARAMTNEPE